MQTMSIVIGAMCLVALIGFGFSKKADKDIKNSGGYKPSKEKRYKQMPQNYGKPYQNGRSEKWQPRQRISGTYQEQPERKGAYQAQKVEAFGKQDTSYDNRYHRDNPDSNASNQSSNPSGSRTGRSVSKITTFDGK